MSSLGFISLKYYEYKGEIRTERNLLIYANFISFFPQLVAGPIERAKNLLPQLKREEKFCFKSLIIGTHWIGWGLFKKLVISFLSNLFLMR